MTSIKPIERISASEVGEFGGKSVALATLAQHNLKIPRSLVIGCDLYRRFIKESGISARLTMELGRKDMAVMRWEELWDTALRLRNLFLLTPLSAALEEEISSALADCFADLPLVIRSSAPEEDTRGTSFAGLHDSFVNVRGRKQQLLAIRKVWASLWSDRALLYRKELKLGINDSAMAVLVQELIDSECSGIAFSKAPDNPEQIAVEAVIGQNQGLVDGSIEPDSWRLQRSGLKIASHQRGARQFKLAPGQNHLMPVALNSQERDRDALTRCQVAAVGAMAMKLEALFCLPQDCEWTWTDDELITLQSRPITSGKEQDQRSWYLNLHRSLENLKTLQLRIENEIMPGMEADAEGFDSVDPTTLETHSLIDELERRMERRQFWEQAYISDCIPMAHGIRLFGQIYNDLLRPHDPFEFVQLLQVGELRATQRNDRLLRLASRLYSDGELSSQDAELEALAAEIALTPDQLMPLLRQMSEQGPKRLKADVQELEKNYFASFSVDEQDYAKDLLTIGRASYRLRDDDNISLNKLVHQTDRAATEARRRLNCGHEQFRAIIQRLNATDQRLNSPPLHNQLYPAVRARQLQGQPASPGLATATARVIRTSEDLSTFQKGEILVCDAIDPGMTFVVPLAAGIIERRGGMLIHGAIIAREYGIPCVSGLPSAADIINSGDRLTIDGDLGLVFFPAGSGQLTDQAARQRMRPELDDIP